MQKQGEKPEWKAKDSAPMETAQKNDAGVRNQTTESTENRFPWTTIAIVAILFIMVATIILFL